MGLCYLSVAIFGQSLLVGSAATIFQWLRHQNFLLFCGGCFWWCPLFSRLDPEALELCRPIVCRSALSCATTIGRDGDPFGSFLKAVVSAV